MRDVTHLMHRYRECARNLWNTQFAQAADLGFALDAFGYIQNALWGWIVVGEIAGLAISDGEDREDPVLRVGLPGRALILVNREDGANGGYWDAERDLMVQDDDIVLQFLAYFDFARIPIADFRYVRCRIVSFPGRMEFQGREALLLSEDVRFFYDGVSSKFPEGFLGS